MMGNRPRVTVAIPLCSLKFQIRESQGDSTPGQTPASNLAPLCPQKRLIFWCGVGIAPLIGIEKWIVFPIAGMLCLLSVLTAEKATDASHAVGWFAPQCCLRAEVWPCFHHQDAYPSFSKGLFGSGGGGFSRFPVPSCPSDPSPQV